MRDRDVVALLTAAGGMLDAPTRDLTPGVMARVEAPSPAARTRPLPRRRLVLVVALLLLLVAAVAIAADLVPGLRLRSGSPAPTTIATLDAEIGFGRVVPADAAIAGTGIATLHLPTLSGLPEPVLRREGDFIHAFYPASATLPEIGESGVGLLVTQVRATFGDDLFFKVVPPGGSQQVAVDGAPGWWIDGPHEVVLDGRGTTRRDGARLADKVLLWHRAGVTYRLEAELPLEQMLEIAKSFDG